jgi:hypothetical protein
LATAAPSSPGFSTNAIIENSCSSAMLQITEFSNSNYAVFRGAGQVRSENPSGSALPSAINAERALQAPRG